MTAGRPLLIIPYAGKFATIGINALVGWTPHAGVRPRGA